MPTFAQGAERYRNSWRSRQLSPSSSVAPRPAAAGRGPPRPALRPGSASPRCPAPRWRRACAAWRTVARRLGDVAAWAEVPHRHPAGQGFGPNASSASPAPTLRVEPHRQARAVWLASWPGERGASSSGSAASGPASRSISARSSPPGRRRRGVGLLRSRTVLSAADGAGHRRARSRPRLPGRRRRARRWSGSPCPTGSRWGPRAQQHRLQQGARPGALGTRTATVPSPAVATPRQATWGKRGSTRSAALARTPGPAPPRARPRPRAPVPRETRHVHDQGVARRPALAR